VSRGQMKAKNGLACLILAPARDPHVFGAGQDVAPDLRRALGFVSRRAGAGTARFAIVAVLGHQRAEVEKALVARHGQGTVTVVEQTEQMGTGHAVRLGLTALRGWEERFSFSAATCPVEPRDRDALVKKSRKGGSLAILTAELSDPHGYGRVIRDGQAVSSQSSRRRMPATMSAASAKSMPAFTPHQQPSFASPQGDCRRATPRASSI